MAFHLDYNTLILILTIILVAVGVPALYLEISRYLHEKGQRAISESVSSFKRARKFLRENGGRIGDESFEYYKRNGLTPFVLSETVLGERIVAPILLRDSWIARYPVPLQDISIFRDPRWQNDKKHLNTIDWATYRGVAQSTKRSEYLLPSRNDGTAVCRYSEAVSEYDAPKLWWDSLAYDICSIDSDAGWKLGFRLGKYFEHFDTEEVLTYELAHALSLGDKSVKELDASLKLRKSLVDPYSFDNRETEVGISTLTLIREGDNCEFVMFKRSEESVATAQGMLSVVPAGEFEPSSQSMDALESDFDLWKNVMREYVEELYPEALHERVYEKLDYEKDPPFCYLAEERTKGLLRVYFLGVVINPASLKPELLTVAIFDKRAFDKIFPHRIEKDEEGDLVWRTRKGKKVQGHKFDEYSIHHFVSSETITGHAVACLLLALRFKDALIA